MPTQSEVAVHLDLSTRSVRELRDAGVIPDPRESTLDEARTAYVRHLRTMAAGRTTAGPLDPQQERAALDRVRREAQELKNAQERGELIPGADGEKIVVDLATATRQRMLAIPPKTALLHAAAGDNPARHKEITEEAIVEALEELTDAGDEAQRRRETRKDES